MVGDSLEDELSSRLLWESIPVRKRVKKEERLFNSSTLYNNTAVYHNHGDEGSDTIIFKKSS